MLMVALARIRQQVTNVAVCPHITDVAALKVGRKFFSISKGTDKKLSIDTPLEERTVLSELPFERFTLLCDWSRMVAPLSQPIRYKNTTNHDLIACVSRAFGS